MWKSVINIGKVIGAVVTIGTATIFLYSIKTGQTEIMQELDYASMERTLISGEVQRIEDSVSRLEAKVDKNFADDKKFRRVWKWEQENRDNFTKGQLDTIRNELLKQNGEPIVFKEETVKHPIYPYEYYIPDPVFIPLDSIEP